jgi:uncharacterized protein (DUF2141 family)
MRLASTLTAFAGALLLAGLALAPVVARGQVTCQGDPSDTKLHVIVQGVRSDEGLMTATLYGDEPDKFLRGAGELKVWREPAKAPVTEMCVWLPGPGTYAMAIYHDAKRAMRFTRGPFGMPTQGYGFSRNPHLFLGPPSLRATTFPAGAGETTVYVKLRYPG